VTRYTPLWEQAGSYAAGTDRHLISAIWPTAAIAGCAVTAPGGTMTLNVAPGAVAVPTQNNTGSTLCVSDAVENVVIGAASAQARIDLIACQPRGNDLDGGSNNDFIFTVIAGTPGASPTPPATPAGAVALAQVAVAANAVAIAAGNLTDVRPSAPLAPPASAPRGTLAQAVATTNSAGTTTNVDWVTAPAFTTDGTRRIRVNYHALVNAGTANDLIGLRLMEGATILQVAQARVPVVGGPGQTSLMGMWEGVPAAGSHTYKTNLTMTGTGPTTGIGSAATPAILLIEDIGI
jgi:hypothetical protein